MTLAYIKSTGRGRIRMRLKIAGSRVEWCTHDDMTSLGTLSRFPGLQLSGLVTDEQVNFATAKIQSQPFTATINDVAIPGLFVSGVGAPYAGTYVFGRAPQNMTWLEPTGGATSINDVVTTIPVQSTAGFPSSDIIWIDSEAILVGSTTATTWTGCTRGYLGTTPAYHYAPGDAIGSLERAEVTDAPWSFKGRRAWLYAYGDGDSPAGNGTLVWTGVVGREPRITDSKTWTVEIGPVTGLWQQSAGADLHDPFQPRGIYFPWDSAFYVGIWQSSDNTAANLNATAAVLEQRITGQFEDNFALAATINSYTATYNVFCVPSPDKLQFELRTASAAQKFIALRAWSRVDQMHGNVTAYHSLAGLQYLLKSDGHTADTGTGTGGSVGASTTYLFPATAVNPAYIAGPLSMPGSVPRGSIYALGVTSRSPHAAAHGGGILAAELNDLIDDTAITSAPNTRMYFGRGANDVSGLTQVVATWSTGEPTVTDVLNVSGANAGSNYADLGTLRVPHDFAGPNDYPRFQGLRVYTSSGTLEDLRAALVTAAPAGIGVGASPDLTAGDFGNWSQAVLRVTSVRPSMAGRFYGWNRPVKLEDVFAGEAQSLGCYFGLDSSGLPELRQVGVPASYSPTAITATHELVSVARSTFERSPRGSINHVVIRLGYSVLDGDWHALPITVISRTAYGRNPISSPAEIKSYSPGQVFGLMSGGIPSPQDLTDYTRVAQIILGIYGYPYATMQVAVPFTHLDVLTGNLVQFTSATMPDDNVGARGLVGKTGLVTGKRVDWGRGVITLTIVVPEGNFAGYTPATRISAISLVSGTTYDLTIDPSNPAGYADVTTWQTLQSQMGGNLSVQWRQWNTTSVANNVYGVFSGVVAGKIRVVFTGPISLAAGTFNLTFPKASGPVDPPDASSQRIYDWIAASTGRIDWNDGTTSRARTFAPG